jgi:undecaprenyl diphosphate synthase
MALFKKKESQMPVDLDRLPRHLAIIMDGNGRWAKKRGLPRTAGHAAGSETFRRIATLCNDLHMEYLTVYAFSTENWKRPKEEVDAIMKLLDKYLREAIEKMEQDNVQLRFFGDLSPLSDELKALCAQTAEISQRCTGLKVNICINYGGRDELVHAARLAAEACLRGEKKPEELTEADLDGYLYSAGTPDVDLVIRPSGEIRISNFLLWQSAYAEYYFTDVLWPDFDKAELMRAFASYQQRDRRFGGVKNG